MFKQTQRAAALLAIIGASLLASCTSSSDDIGGPSTVYVSVTKFKLGSTSYEDSIRSTNLNRLSASAVLANDTLTVQSNMLSGDRVTIVAKRAGGVAQFQGSYNITPAIAPLQAGNGQFTITKGSDAYSTVGGTITMDTVPNLTTVGASGNLAIRFSASNGAWSNNPLTNLPMSGGKIRCRVIRSR